MAARNDYRMNFWVRETRQTRRDSAKGGDGGRNERRDSITIDRPAPLWTNTVRVR